MFTTVKGGGAAVSGAAEASQFFGNLRVRYRTVGAVHTLVVYLNELVIVEIRNNAPAIFQKFLSAVVK
jgi:hypothetical protein